MKTNVLYYGDNLDILRKREYFPDESVDLIYLDPPFNSNRSYNVLFRESTGAASEAQIEAFEDTWHWGPAAMQTYDDVVTGPHQKVARMLRAMVDGLGHNDVTAYLAMMAVRLVELRRVLKVGGALYLHCDRAMSHYLRFILDQIFGPSHFQNEVIWSYRRWPVKMPAFQRMHDTILYYTKGDPAVFNVIYEQASDSFLRRFKGSANRLDPGATRKRAVGTPTPGMPLRDVWDLSIVAGSAKERLGYPTQKPLALLERIINASSNPGDIVFDPFCGCGTAVHAAHKLGRRWIGIDITHLAIGLVRRRMQDAFPSTGSGEAPGLEIEVIGEPVDLAGARDLAQRDKYQFQWWALDRLGAQPVSGKKKGSDKGIDGVIPFFAGPKEDYKRAIVSVKGGEHVNVAMVRDLIGVLDREKEPIGVLLTLEPPTQPMVTEAAAAGFYHSDFWQKDFPRVQILTVEEMLAGKRPQIPLGRSPFAQAPLEREGAQQARF